MKEKWDDNCKSCQAIQGLISLTNTPRILETSHWILEHDYPSSIKGWLVIVLKRHCRALHDLTKEEMLEFGELLSNTCQALHKVMRTESEYVVQFAEGDGFHHVHFHVIARLPQWPDTLRGFNVISGVGKAVINPLQSEDLTPIVLDIRGYLKNNLPADLIIS